MFLSKYPISLEEINEDTNPECERDAFGNFVGTGVTIIGIYDDGPTGFLVIRKYKSIFYLAYLAVRSILCSKG